MRDLGLGLHHGLRLYLDDLRLRLHDLRLRLHDLRLHLGRLGLSLDGLGLRLNDRLGLRQHGRCRHGLRGGLCLHHGLRLYLDDLRLHPYGLRVRLYNPLALDLHRWAWAQRRRLSERLRLRGGFPASAQGGGHVAH